MAGPVVLATSPFLRADPLHDRATPARLQATIVSDLAGSGHGPAAQEPADTFSPAAGRNGERAMAVRETERLADCEPHRPAKHYSVSVKAVSRRGASTQFQVFVNPVSAAREGDRAAAAPELKLLKTYADCEELARGLSLKHIRFSTKHVPANIFSASHKEIAVESVGQRRQLCWRQVCCAPARGEARRWSPRTLHCRSHGELLQREWTKFDVKIPSYVLGRNMPAPGTVCRVHRRRSESYLTYTYHATSRVGMIVFWTSSRRQQSSKKQLRAGINGSRSLPFLESLVGPSTGFILA